MDRTPLSRAGLSLLLACLVLGGVAAPETAHAQDRLTVLSSLDPALIDFLETQAQKLPFEFDFVYIADESTLSTWIRSPGAEQPRPDLLYGVSTIVLSQLAEQGLLEVISPEWEADLPVGLADRDHRWAGLFGDPLTIVYNRDYFDAEDLLRKLPDSWADLGHSRFRGSLIFEEPSPYNQAGYLFACIIDRSEKVYGDSERGFELLADWDRNLLRTYLERQSLLSPLGLFSGGDGSITVASAAEIERCLEQDFPVDFRPPAEGLFLYPRGVALLEDAAPDAREAYRALTHDAFLRKLTQHQGCYPLIAGNQYRFSIWPGERINLELLPTDHDSVRRNIHAWIGRWQNLIQGKGKEREEMIDNAINTVMTFLIPLFLVVVIITSRRGKK